MHNVNYQADGLNMIGAYFPPVTATGPVPGVLVFPEAFGLGEHVLERAQSLANMGYAALACDLHGSAEYISNLASVRDRLAVLRQKPARIIERANAALQVLTAMPEVDPHRIGAIGFCFGGAMALELARSGAALRAVVGFHCSLGTEDTTRAHQIKARLLMCIGANDPVVPEGQRLAFEREMTAGGVDWQILLHGGVVHSFTDPAADYRGDPTMFRYDTRANRRSSVAMSSLLEEVFFISPE